MKELQNDYRSTQLAKLSDSFPGDLVFRVWCSYHHELYLSPGLKLSLLLFGEMAQRT